ncbi:ketimine reductase mu-crystallin-like [Corythoichthys intestinalis]|uniref:ketimine reductase mu-crystallin-like n=1 Tax=Corythoichthys intestinalis TaxID=161448 RepID=UPI0025A592C4|nr:ketimine reductase mu-crystallin-like [Corythoichthys intestinalis]XP_061807385.1 ketimine reductase mu-crystallin-like [Nerophis lumbriciformis]
MAEPPAVISENQVSRFLRYSDLIPRLEDALAKFSLRDTSEVIQPLRFSIPLKKHSRDIFLMPTYMENNGILCTKFLSIYNREKGSEPASDQATVVLLDPDSGRTMAVIQGNVLTYMRTAAASAISAKLLMPHKAEVLAILGTGQQALSHYDVFTEMFSFKEVRVWGRSKQGMERFQSSVSGSVTLCDSTATAVTEADVIVTVTSSSEPVLFGQWVKPGAHVAAVGACRPDWRELDEVLMKEAVVYVDSREGAAVESGDILLSGVEVFAELGEVISGGKPALREKTTVFESLGMGLEDAVSAKLVFDQWKASNQPKGVGFVSTEAGTL